MATDLLLSNIWLLESMKVLIFVGGFLFATSYLLPKGIVAVSEWKETKVYRKLITGVSFISGGLLILLYFLATFIISHISSVFGGKIG